jgi:hypothetical protein
MTEQGIPNTNTINPPECKHLRKEIRIVPGIRKKLMFGRCMLMRDNGVREEINKAADKVCSGSVNNRDCRFFESHSWKACPRHLPADQ